MGIAALVALLVLAGVLVATQPAQPQTPPPGTTTSQPGSPPPQEDCGCGVPSSPRGPR